MKRRVLRGGCWYYHARFCRAAMRDADDPGDRYRYVGFRIAVIRSKCKEQ